MKLALLLFFFIVSKSQAACLPDSPINKAFNFNNAREAENAIEVFDLTVKDLIPPKHELIIRVDSLNPRVNADIIKSDNEILISIMGGMFNHPDMSPEVLQLLLCHELGHFLGGPPLKSRNGWSSTEGQADYYTGLKCARILGFNEGMFLDASLKLTSIYAQVVRENVPELSRCDVNVAERTNYGYPSVQCRLDTMVAGWNQMNRPQCWFR